jgi:hypothetical protein
LRRSALALFALAALPAAAQNTNDPRDARTTGKSDFELEQERRDYREGEIRLPGTPKADALVEFFPSSASSFRFFVDSDSVTVVDGIVRYTLIARSANGYDNVTYEGLRCATNAVRVYAYGDAGKWSRASSDWKPIENRSVQRWHNELRSRYFCPLGLPIMTADEGKRALRAGGHPLVPANNDLRR